MASRPMTSKPSSKRKHDADLEALRDIADDVIESDFVPYAGLRDPFTLVTKNGELVQTLKITGLGFDAQAQRDLRGSIRTAIQQCIPDESYAIWLHTLRRRKQLVASSPFPDKFSAAVDAAWSETHPASASYVNELYITVVKAGEDASLRQLYTLLRSLRPNNEAMQRNAFLDAAMQALNVTTDKLVQQLAAFGARRLQVVERQGMYYSEQLEFLEKLINLEERPMPVPMRDLSQVLTSGDITFGHNSMEVRTAEGKRRFACILTLKEYKESTLGGIDKFLDVPCELIISQCFDFVGANAAKQAYETQARYLAISGDKELASWMEIDRLTQQHSPRSYGEQQTTIFLIAPAIRALEQSVRLCQKALSKLGMVAVREDLRFEECYWAQLPGNFPFISRKRSVNTQHIAGFATVQTQPMGNASGSAWGPPVSLLTTVQDAPYFFNFQRDQLMHTLVLGRPKSGRSSVAHFLLAQARRLPITLWYLDVHGRGGPTIEAMGGKRYEPGTPNCQLNPFAMPDTQANREFLAIWLCTLIDPEAKQLTRSSLAFFQSLVDAVMRLPQPERRLSALLPIVRAQDAMLAMQLQRWCAGGERGELFDMPRDHFQPDALCVWDIARYCDDTSTRIPLASYLLHRLTMALSGAPTLFVLDEAFRLLDNPLFGQRTPAWLDYLAQANCSAMLMTDDVSHSGSYAYAAPVAQRAASIFAMPEPQPGGEYVYGFGFTDADMAALAHMSSAHRHVLLKRGEQSTMLKMDLSNLGQHLPTLSGRVALTPQKSAVDLLSELMGYGSPKAEAV